MRIRKVPLPRWWKRRWLTSVTVRVRRTPRLDTPCTRWLRPTVLPPTLLPTHRTRTRPTVGAIRTISTPALPGTGQPTRLWRGLVGMRRVRQRRERNKVCCPNRCGRQEGHIDCFHHYARHDRLLTARACGVLVCSFVCSWSACQSYNACQPRPACPSAVRHRRRCVRRPAANRHALSTLSTHGRRELRRGRIWALAVIAASKLRWP